MIPNLGQEVSMTNLHLVTMKTHEVLFTHIQIKEMSLLPKVRTWIEKRIWSKRIELGKYACVWFSVYVCEVIVV